MNDNLKVLEYAMEMEKQGRDFYLKNKDMIKDSKGKDLFEELAAVEAEHYELLKKYHNYLSEEEQGDPLNLEDESKIFEKQLEDSNINFDTLNGSDLAIMRMAYIIENDFAEFYKNAAKSTEDEAIKELLEELAEWENGHRRVFYDRFNNMMQQNWFKQNFAPF